MIFFSILRIFEIIKNKNVHCLNIKKHLFEGNMLESEENTKKFFSQIKYGEIINFVIKYLQYDAVNFFYFNNNNKILILIINYKI